LWVVEATFVLKFAHNKMLNLIYELQNCYLVTHLSFIMCFVLLIFWVLVDDPLAQCFSNYLDHNTLNHLCRTKKVCHHRFCDTLEGWSDTLVQCYSTKSSVSRNIWRHTTFTLHKWFSVSRSIVWVALYRCIDCPSALFWAR
jgi:hypothetical protein